MTKEELLLQRNLKKPQSTMSIIVKVIIIVNVILEKVKCTDVVVTVQGRIRGVNHGHYITYSGIPYASISGEENKYKRAGLAPFWQGIRESSRTSCTTSSSPEDCLKLDINVPFGSSSWPVLVWVTGGEDNFSPGLLVQEGIIVIVVYHRLGPQGFLCLNEEKIPGNAGVKDVVAALHWVRDNVVAFRGNPAQVIIAGHGFAAAMVEALTLSHMAQGLFHGVILQSGSVLSPSAFNYDAKERAEALSNLIPGYDDTVEALLSTSASSLAAESDRLYVPYFPFGICIERDYVKEEQLITESPLKLLSQRKGSSVPMIIGFNSQEAYIFTYTLNTVEAVRKLSRNAENLLPAELKIYNDRVEAHVARQIMDAYFKRNMSMTSVISYYSDAIFTNHIYRSMQLHSSFHQVYFYQFSHVGLQGVEEDQGVKKTGAAHSDELAYLFPERDRRLDGEDGTVQAHLLRLWTNFVKRLNPTPNNESPTWETTDAHNPRFMNIASTLEMRQFDRKHLMQMWEEIYEKYYYGRYR